MAWQEYDPWAPTPKKESFWVRWFKRNKQKKCLHPNGQVEWLIVQPITMLPKEGKCKLCGKRVKAKILWE